MGLAAGFDKNAEVGIMLWFGSPSSSMYIFWFGTGYGGAFGCFVLDLGGLSALTKKSSYCTAALFSNRQLKH